jgi:fumarate reductase subunit D
MCPDVALRVLRIIFHKVLRLLVTDQFHVTDLWVRMRRIRHGMHLIVSDDLPCFGI